MVEHSLFQKSGHRDAGVSTTNIENSIFILENSDSGGCEIWETSNLFLNPSIMSFVTDEV